MEVYRIMRSPVVTVNPQTTLAEAWKIMKNLRIRHLPVISEGRLVGIVSDRDLRSASPAFWEENSEEKTCQIWIGQIMSKNVITIAPDDTIDEAARIMYEFRIGSLPVVDGKYLVGLLTQSDILRALTELLGVHEPGSQLILEIPDRPGVLADIAIIFKNLGVNIVSVVTLPKRRHEEYRLMVIRVNTIDPRKIMAALQQAGYIVRTPRLEDTGYGR
ncbi:MAG: CBS and ACT domain-containing protein [Bacillota bacterium]|uniref:Acetoin utilization protein AcuB n=2 Tax=Carboxydocella TaxID=178898 RepID=A0A1T4QSI6_9FIRM|nr:MULTISPECIES: CBS and ACT domain-containing protein [Carboxydocella]AVX20818.1 acetoin utilization protein AcuB [Carboxydocella thermautotrophica]AVX31237.1 acetoin utilization protein AcuB [Carboxydocella thermautotrophica]SKA06690.1 acetoin utilization protein AcuB [Carboxydocella sporoproducens DSM 16521]GAW30012.1 acetoin utilization protein AcuB [Carboxydocella sp. ULO1]GAW32085.1 acetoin utilization protein AcuB [Carboxydocella sp. JDF658]